MWLFVVVVVVFVFLRVICQIVNRHKKSRERKRRSNERNVNTRGPQYLKFNDYSGDEPHQAITSFTVHLINVYKVRLVTLGVASVIIFLDCPTLESLERLWSDCLSGHLHKVAERYLVTDEMKKKLNLETISLKATIEQENYLNCKKALMERPSTCSGEFKQSVWKVQLCCIWSVKLGLSVARVYNSHAIYGNND